MTRVLSLLPGILPKRAVRPVLILPFLLVLFLVLAVDFEPAGTVSGQGGVPTDDVTVEDPDPLRYPLLGSRLSWMASDVEDGTATAADAAGRAFDSRGSQVGVIVSHSGSASSFGSYVQRTGGEVLYSGDGYIEAYVEVAALGGLSRLYGLSYARELVPPVSALPPMASHPAPAQPANFVLRRGSEHIYFFWSDPRDSSITKYEYESSSDPSCATGFGTPIATDLIRRMGGMDDTLWSPGMARLDFPPDPLPDPLPACYRIRAVADDGSSDVENVKNGPWTGPVPLPDSEFQPSAPVVAGSAGPDSRQATLNVSVSPSSDAVQRYQYQQSSDGGSMWSDWDNLSVMPFPTWPTLASAGDFMLPSLDNGVEYRFAVRAVNFDGQAGPASNVVSVTPMVPPALPPLGFRAVGMHPGIELTWSAPESRVPSGYQLVYRRSGGAWPDWPADLVGGTLGFTSPHLVPGLEHGVRYDFRLRAVYAGPPPEYSAALTASASAVSGYNPPSSLTAERGDGAVTLTWTAAVSPPPPPLPEGVSVTLTGYDLMWRLMPDGDWTDWPAVGDSSPSTVSGLHNDRSYEFELRAVYSDDSSGSLVAGYSPGVRVSAPAVFFPPPLAFVVTGAHPGFEISWSAPDGLLAPRAYVLRYRCPANGGWSQDYSYASAPDPPIRLAGVAGGGSCEFELKAVYGGGSDGDVESEVLTASAVAMTGYGPPRLLAARAGDRQVLLSWGAPDFSRSSVSPAELSEYQLRWKRSVDTDWSAWAGLVLSGGLELSHVVTGLENRRAYDFEFRAEYTGSCAADAENSLICHSDPPYFSAPAEVSAIPTAPPVFPLGRVVSEGVRVHQADAWHRAGYGGRGVKIGVVDTGFKSIDDLIRSGEISPIPAERRNCSLADCSGRGKHGTAVVETILDVAPLAEIYICDMGVSTCTDWFGRVGVDVVNASLTFPLGSVPCSSGHCGDPVKEAVDDFPGLWVNGAGNYGDRMWYSTGPFVDGDGDGFIEFSQGVESSGIRFRSLEEDALVQMRWDDRGGTVDLELWVWDRIAGRPVFRHSDYGSSTFPSRTVRAPYASSNRYGVAVRVVPGARPRWIQLNVFNNAASLELVSDPSVGGSITNPAEAYLPNLLAVGASDIPNAGEIIAPYSSRGPVPGVTYTKPDLVGVAGGRSATRDGPFHGTSQAAPHITGLAALVKGRYPDLNPKQLADYLKSHARPPASERRPDHTWGYGLVRLPEPELDLDTGYSVFPSSGVRGTEVVLSGPSRFDYCVGRQESARCSGPTAPGWVPGPRAAPYEDWVKVGGAPGSGDYFLTFRTVPAQGELQYFERRFRVLPACSASPSSGDPGDLFEVFCTDLPPSGYTVLAYTPDGNPGGRQLHQGFPSDGSASFSLTAGDPAAGDPDFRFSVRYPWDDDLDSSTDVVLRDVLLRFGLGELCRAFLTDADHAFGFRDDSFTFRCVGLVPGDSYLLRGGVGHSDYRLMPVGLDSGIVGESGIVEVEFTPSPPFVLDAGHHLLHYGIEFRSWSGSTGSERTAPAEFRRVYIRPSLEVSPGSGIPGVELEFEVSDMGQVGAVYIESDRSGAETVRFRKLVACFGTSRARGYADREGVARFSAELPRGLDPDRDYELHAYPYSDVSGSDGDCVALTPPSQSLVPSPVASHGFDVDYIRLSLSPRAVVRGQEGVLASVETGFAQGSPGEPGLASLRFHEATAICPNPDPPPWRRGPDDPPTSGYCRMDVSERPLEEVRVDYAGGWFLSFTVPVDIPLARRVGAEAGSYQVTVRASDGTAAWGSVTVSEPSLRVEPGESARGQEVSVEGTGYPADTWINFHYGQGSCNVREIGSGSGLFDGMRSGPQGSFSKEVEIPASVDHGSEYEYGDFYLVARSRDTDPVLCAGAEHTVPGPGISLVPSVALTGLPLQVSGYGFTPFLHVSSVNVGDLPALHRGAVAVDKDGYFSMTVTVPRVEPGYYPLRLHLSNGRFVAWRILVARPGPPLPVEESLAKIIGSVERVWLKESSAAAGWQFWVEGLDEVNTLRSLRGGDGVWIKFSGSVEYGGVSYQAGWHFIYVL